MKPRTILAALLAIAVFGTDSAAQSIHTLPQGTKLSGTVEFARYVLPLPPGEWILVGAMRDRSNPHGGHMASPLGRAFLVQIERGTLVAMIEATANLDTQRHVWTFSSECRRTDYWLVEMDQNHNMQHQDCRIVSHSNWSWVAVTDSPDSYKKAMQWLQEQRVVCPPQVLRSMHRRVRFDDLLTITYSVNPEYFGQRRSADTIWGASDWHRARYPQQPERYAFAQAWIEWSNQMAPIFAEGFRGNRAAAAPPFPFKAPAPGT